MTWLTVKWALIVHLWRCSIFCRWLCWFGRHYDVYDMRLPGSPLVCGRCEVSRVPTCAHGTPLEARGECCDNEYYGGAL